MSALLRERLRGLRAQAGASTAGATPAPGARPSLPTLDADLRRLIALRATGRGTFRSGPPATADREVPGEELSPGLRLTEACFDWPVPPASIDTGFARIEGSVGRHRLLHFDTETTGLAGGTGTRAFMIGVADWQGGQLRVRQLTITSLAAEAAMLRTFAGWVADDAVLVSYNGKCYDAPLLATRFRLARLANPLAGLPHLDLLHPVRRVWKGRWPNCRLATAERELLGVVREDDLPGSEAPAAWLGYLRGGPATALRRVLAHNSQDLKSLAGVLRHLAGTQPVAGQAGG